MPVNVRVLLAVSVFPSAIVKVEPVAGAVIATLLILVADATPRVGVVRDGLVANTRAPDPVSSDITPANSEDVVAANCASVPPVVAIVPACKVTFPSGNVTVLLALNVAGVIVTA